MFKCAKVIHD